MSNVLRRGYHKGRKLAVRLTGVRPTFGEVERFDDVPGATAWNVDLPTSLVNFAPAQTLHECRADLLDKLFATTPPPAQPRAARLRGARLVTADGVLATEDGLLIKETLLDDEHWNRNFRRPRRVRRARLVGGEWAALLSPWSGNYYHWLIDCLPRVAVLRAIGLDNFNFIVRGPMAPFQLDSLHAVQIDCTDALLMDDDDQFLVEDLIWASSPARVNFPTPFIVAWLRDVLGPGRSLAPGHIRAAADRRLLVSRADTRRISNESQLLRALEPLGFELVQPDRLDLEDQVAVFADARYIVGAHGAALTNMVFAVTATVLELFPPQRVAWHYYTLARAAGHEYWYAIGRDAADRRTPRVRDFAIDISLVVKTVEAMLASD